MDMEKVQTRNKVSKSETSTKSNEKGDTAEGNERKLFQVPVKKQESFNHNGVDTAWAGVYLAMYLLFITIVYIITSGSRSQQRYFLSKVIYELFIDAEFEGYGKASTTFRDSSTIHDFWAFTETVMLRGIYREEWQWHHYDYIKEPTKSADEGELYDNKLVGRARLRQIRMVKNECQVAKMIPILSRDCYPEYIKSKEETGQFHRYYKNDEGWKHGTEDELLGTTYFGSLNNYGASGYSLLLETNSKDAVNQLLPLKNNLWITRATRAVFLDFTFLNPNINIFCTVRLSWEIPATGGVTTSWNIQTIHVIRYSTRYEIFVLVCQIFFICLTALQIILEFINLIRERWGYFRDLWNYISIAMLVISIYCIIYIIGRYFTFKQIVQELVTDSGHTHIDFQSYAFWENIFNSVTAIGIFLMWIKLLKYLSFISTMSRLFGTITRCAKDIGGFGIIFLIIFFAFTQFGCIVFGNHVFAFSNMGRSIFTLLAFMLGEFNYKDVEDTNRLLGPIFFVSYVVFVFMILANMFLAIINSSYHTTREVIDPLENEKELMDGFGCSLNCCCKKHNPITSQEIVILSEIEIDPAQIKTELKKKNFTDVEIEMFFARFDIYEEETLDADEAQKLLSDVTLNQYRIKNIPGFNLKKHNSTNVLPVDKVSKEILKAERQNTISRLGLIESTIVNFLPKFETVFAKLDAYAKMKAKAKPEIKQLI